MVAGKGQSCHSSVWGRDYWLFFSHSNPFKEQPLEQLLGIDCFTVWMFHGGIILSVPLEEDLLGWGLWWDWGLAYLLFCAAYWSRQPRVFWHLSHSCFNLLHTKTRTMEHWSIHFNECLKKVIFHLNDQCVVFFYCDQNKMTATLGHVTTMWLANFQHGWRELDGLAFAFRLPTPFYWIRYITCVVYILSHWWG